jgi:hypothetical protein
LHVAAPDDDRDPPPDEPPSPAEPSSAAEPRARDIASAKTTADLEQKLDEKLDPQTIAQLASWFGLPSFEQLEEERRRAEAPPEEPDERALSMAKAAAAVDPSMITLLERHVVRGDRMLGDRLPPPMESPVRDISRFDVSLADQLGQLAEPREVERPMWIEDARKESSPQAILRDLYRPETTFNLGYPLPDPEPTLAELTGDIRAIATRSYRVRPDLASAAAQMRELMGELRHWKQVPWGELTFPKRSEAPDGERGDDPAAGWPGDDE